MLCGVYSQTKLGTIIVCNVFLFAYFIVSYVIILLGVFPPSLEPIAADCHIGEECRKALLSPAEDVPAPAVAEVAADAPVGPALAEVAAEAPAAAAAADPQAPDVPQNPCRECGAPKACETCFKTQLVKYFEVGNVCISYKC